MKLALFIGFLTTTPFASAQKLRGIRSLESFSANVDNTAGDPTCNGYAINRKIMWDLDTNVPLNLPSRELQMGEAPILCPETCNFLVAKARKVSKREADQEKSR